MEELNFAELIKKSAESKKPQKKSVKQILDKSFERVVRFFNINQIYYLDARQAYRKVVSDYAVWHSIILAKGDDITAEEHDAVVELDKIKDEADKINRYEELWPHIHLMELQVLRLYDMQTLKSHVTIIRNNLYLLDSEDQKRWTAILDTFTDDSVISSNSGYFRSIVYTLTAEIQEVRRINFMTTDLKRALMRRFFWITLIIGLFAWIFAFAIIRDPLVHYAVVFGVLGGFFSRVLSIRDLEFKAPAFSLMALYTYIQPLLGGIGAVILYLLLISPIGPQIISGDTFYLSQQETHKYVVAKLSEKSVFIQHQVPSIVSDTTKESTSRVISQYPKPGLFLLLSFLAGFSERWLLGTLETIVGKKLQKESDANQPAEPSEKK